jgi:hypothetical protein
MWKRRGKAAKTWDSTFSTPPQHSTKYPGHTINVREHHQLWIRTMNGTHNGSSRQSVKSEKTESALTMISLFVGTKKPKWTDQRFGNAPCLCAQQTFCWCVIATRARPQAPTKFANSANKRCWRRWNSSRHKQVLIVPQLQSAKLPKWSKWGRKIIGVNLCNTKIADANLCNTWFVFKYNKKHI